MDQNNLIFNLTNNLTKQIYKLTISFPYKHQSSIGDQLRRASLSVILNMVKGAARRSDKEKNQFRNISFGSLKETKYLVYFSFEQQLIESATYEEIMAQINQIAKLMYSILHKNKKTPIS